MKITSIETRLECFPLTRPYTIAFRSVDSVEMGLLEITTDEGFIGRGCASPEPYVTGEDQELCAAALADDKLDWLLGRHVRDLPRLCRELRERFPRTPAARAAVDIALHDLFGQAHDRPLVDVLGRAHSSLPTSITIGIKPTVETLEEAQEYLGRGFRVLKVKLGHSLDEDLERLSKLRESIGPDVLIRVDPNQGYEVADVIAFFEGTSDLDIELVEQPVAVDKMNGLRNLPAAMRERIAADESLLDERDAVALAANPAACGIFNVKLMKCGGVAAAGRIVQVAERQGIRLMWGCNDESIISISAALHVALASPATCFLDLDGSLDLERDVVSGGFVLEDGMMRTIDAPGLGVKAL